MAVIGAGIAGLTFAHALHIAGIPCQVFEQASELHEVGAGIQLAPNATRILGRLGFDEPLRKVAVGPEAIQMRRWNDAGAVSRTELGRACEQTYGAPYWTMYRPDLQKCLLDALPPGMLSLDRRCVAVAEQPYGVLLRFADGTEHTAEICVGADGIHSVVRTVLIADQPRFSGQSIYRGVVPAQRVPFLLDQPEVVLWLGPHRHFVHYPVASGRLVSFAATTPSGQRPSGQRPSGQRPSGQRLPESWSAKADPAEIAAAYRGWHPDVTRVIAAAGVVHRWMLHDRDTTGNWRTRRIALIGDAAHPMLPFLAQGANQAIEDAAVLAGCLRDEPEPRHALERYESARRHRVEKVHQISRRNAVSLHLVDGDGQQKRDANLHASQRLEEQRWLYGYDPLTT